MDQLAPVFHWLKRNGFWLISALVAMLLIGGWFLASGQIGEQTSSQVRTLNKSFSDMSSAVSYTHLTLPTIYSV